MRTSRKCYLKENIIDKYCSCSLLFYEYIFVSNNRFSPGEF
jgi:hypothetical protein